MEYRKLGTSELELSAITFGAWAAGGWMWGGTNRKEAKNAILAGYELGVTSIDTAAVYGQGTSEEIVGEAIKELQRDKVQVLTKFGIRWDTRKGEFYFASTDNLGNPIDVYKYSGKSSVIKECEDSLKRLGTDYIDLYQIHTPDSTTPIEETMEALSLLTEQGKVRYAGVSNYSLEQIKEASRYIQIVSNQVKYNMLVRDIEEELIPYLISQKQSVLAYSPMERGLLSGKMKPGHPFAEGDHRAGKIYFKDENILRTNKFLQKIKPIADEKNATLSQLVLRWTLEQPGITIALVGARNPEQAIQNAKASNVKLSQDEMDFINNELKQLVLAE